jgi:HlyD family secretion protein
MTAWLTLPFAKPSRHGYIAGEVLDVSDYVSGNSASIHLGSQELAEQMSKQLGPMLEVLVKIELDESTPTGLRWTSGRGYDQPVTFPSLCGVKIIVSEDRPIDIVLPWLKDLLGLDPQVKVLKDRPQ